MVSPNCLAVSSISRTSFHYFLSGIPCRQDSSLRGKNWRANEPGCEAEIDGSLVPLDHGRPIETLQVDPRGSLHVSRRSFSMHINHGGELAPRSRPFIKSPRFRNLLRSKLKTRLLGVAPRIRGRNAPAGGKIPPYHPRRFLSSSFLSSDGGGARRAFAELNLSTGGHYRRYSAFISAATNRSVLFLPPYSVV